MLFVFAWYKHLPQVYFSPSWTALLCRVRCCFCEASYGHCSQEQCSHELHFCVEQDVPLMSIGRDNALKDNIILHELLFYAWQGCFIPSWTTLLCPTRLPFDVDWYLHCSQGYFVLSWIALSCSARLPFDVNWYWHYPHGYFIPSWTASLCLIRSPFDVD